MDALKLVVENYIRFVYLWEEDENGQRWCEKPEDLYYLANEFKFSAVNNWESGFDIVEWYEGIGDYAKDGHYKCGRQGSVVELVAASNLKRKEGLHFEMTLRNYAYDYLYKLSIQDLRRLLQPN
jgi:hypothetical protein